MTYEELQFVKRGEIYTVDIVGSDEQRYAVRESDSPRGYGDTIHKTEALAQEYANWLARSDADKAIQAARDGVLAEANRLAEIQRNDIDGFGAGLSPMARGRVVAVLNEVVNYRGMIMSRKQLVRERIADGWLVGVCPLRGEVLESPDGAILSAKSITKTAIDYAGYLLSAASTRYRTISPA